ncbi:trans-sialidase [Trypanosoma cruzi Dm28c]|uniref:Trans-sialidase n=2 Tax=Trypanosoma cruzi TaxID=5693 RepID=V5AKB9_TRYCR|nr:trans-sialidase [Trypanosoma cruzi Dm28c]PBJ76409.1 trans-sialidase [Trypanosoma cruzi cruzi]PWU90455.1 putative trans-sialidase, Group VI [Trypanosoma cruzi]
MLSRVAADKAPRTHNRCRVTGSSGRRREGGESERQRPNMSRRVFTSAVPLLLVVMMCCSTCGGVQADEDLLVDPKYKLEDITDGNLKLFGIPGLLKVGSDVFAVAEVQCKKGEDTFTGIASQLLTIKDDNTPEKALKNARVIQVLEEGVSTEAKKVEVSRPTAVVKGSDIYMLVGKYSGNAGARESAAAQSGILLVKGTVSGEESNKQIDWKDTNAVPKTAFGEHDSSMQLIGSGGSGVKLKDGTLVFPVEGTKKDGTEEDEKTKTVFLVLYLQDTKSWKLSKGMSADGCSDPSVVEWEKDKLMMMTACDDGRRRVYESADKGESWTEALGTLSRVWGSNKHEGSEKLVRSGFTTATIGVGDDDKNVMLVTLPVYAKDNNIVKGELHLWLTDNTHIVDIGPISGDDEDVAASALLYKSGTDDNKNEKLIALYEEKKGSGESSNSLFSVRPTAQLQRVKDVLATWKKVDKRVSGLCPSESAAQAPSPESACSTKITAGLVGFLSGNFSDDTWRDEYLGVNATVKKGKKEGVPAEKAETTGTSDGVKFRGTWAEWPVGAQGENELYHFANYNFTLVATVSIDGEPKEGDTPIPVMGAKMNDDDKNPVLLGLSYNKKEKKWILLCGGKPTEVQKRIEGQEKTQQVAIVLQNGTQGSAYVDGNFVGNAQCEFEGKEDKKISHFYIGGDGSNTEGQGGVSVTVTNVLLYNRPLDGNEITALNTIKPPITPPKDPNAQKIVVPSFGGTPHAGQEPLNGGEGVGGGIASSAASIAATPSSDVAQKVATMGGDKMQGDGSHQTPEVSMSSGADGEAAGGTYGQEEIHPQDMDVNATALSSSLGNLSQGNNSDGGTVRGRRVLPLLLLLLGLWGFAAQ